MPFSDDFVTTGLQKFEWSQENSFKGEKSLFVDQRHDVRIQLNEHWDVINYYLGMLGIDYVYMYTEVSELSWHLCDSLLFLPRTASNDFCWLAVIKKFSAI